MLISFSTKNETQRILEILEKNSFKFYLTGSRFFGTDRPDSDWDFFTQDSPEVRQFLRENGFREINPDSYFEFEVTDFNDYCDENTATVFRNGKVDIQCQIDVQLKILTQEFIKHSPTILDILKKTQTPYKVWNSVMLGIKRVLSIP